MKTGVKPLIGKHVCSTQPDTQRYTLKSRALLLVTEGHFFRCLQEGGHFCSLRPLQAVSKDKLNLQPTCSSGPSDTHSLLTLFKSLGPRDHSQTARWSNAVPEQPIGTSPSSINTHDVDRLNPSSHLNLVSLAFVFCKGIPQTQKSEGICSKHKILLPIITYFLLRTLPSQGSFTLLLIKLGRNSSLQSTSRKLHKSPEAKSPWEWEPLRCSAREAWDKGGWVGQGCTAG